MAEMSFNVVHNFRQKRDAYGFALRPQHVERYREYLGIYKEEEAERAEKWKNFLERQDGPAESCSSEEEFQDTFQVEPLESGEESAFEGQSCGNDSGRKKHDSDCSREREPVEELLLPKEGTIETSTEIPKERDLENEVQLPKELECSNEGQLVRDSDPVKQKRLPEETEPEKEKRLSEGSGSDEEQQNSKQRECEKCLSNVKEDGPKQEEQDQRETKTCTVQKWAKIRPSLASIESMMCSCVKKLKHMKDRQRSQIDDHLPSINESISFREEAKENSVEDAPSNEASVSTCYTPKEENLACNSISQEPFFPWKEELEVLVRLGVPRELRGEVWQAFVGVKARRVEGYYQDLLAQTINSDESNEQTNSSDVSRKWKRQIEKDIPRTFPNHPALNDDGRDSLRRILLAYACHNPSVGYCQAMNFFAGLLLLLMPEENAFWTLVGVIDDYFDGYFTEEMIECQVDQLVFEELMRERFPKLVNHLDYLGVQVAWISGPWFLSIFVNMLPWESVLRIWDVLLFEGNRVMLFRTALALMELYGPALVTTKDAGDAITLLQNLTGSTFDSSQLVLTACMGYFSVTEARLKHLRKKHRPAVLEVVEERRTRGRIWKDSKGLASKLYSFKHERSALDEKKTPKRTDDEHADQDNSCSQHQSLNLDELPDGVNVDSELDSLPDLQEQVAWMKVELCRLLEEKRSAELRAEELETALMEMVKEDNRLLLNAQIEKLENEVKELRQALADKKEQEAAMLQVMMKVEQEQKLTEDARVRADEDVAAQRYAVRVLEEKYDKAMAQIAEMEKRVVVAESMLEATLQYESGQSKAHASPRFARNQGSAQDSPKKKTGFLSFGFSWRDKNKAKQSEESSENNSIDPAADSKPPLQVSNSKLKDHLHQASKS